MNIHTYRQTDKLETNLKRIQHFLPHFVNTVPLKRREQAHCKDDLSSSSSYTFDLKGSIRSSSVLARIRSRRPPTRSRSFLRYRLFSQFFVTYPSPKLGCYWLIRQWEWLIVHSHALSIFEDLLQRYLGEGFGKNNINILSIKIKTKTNKNKKIRSLIDIRNHVIKMIMHVWWNNLYIFTKTKNEEWYTHIEWIEW